MDPTCFPSDLIVMLMMTNCPDFIVQGLPRLYCTYVLVHLGNSFFKTKIKYIKKTVE